MALSIHPSWTTAQVLGHWSASAHDSVQISLELFISKLQLYEKCHCIPNVLRRPWVLNFTRKLYQWACSVPVVWLWSQYPKMNAINSLLVCMIHGMRTESSPWERQWTIDQIFYLTASSAITHHWHYFLLGYWNVYTVICHSLYIVI